MLGAGTHKTATPNSRKKLSGPKELTESADAHPDFCQLNPGEAHKPQGPV